MAVTFDPTLPTARHRLRFRAGDADASAGLLQDETYDALLTLRADDEDRALLDVVEHLLVRFGQEPSKFEGVGAVKAEWEERLRVWRELRAQLRADLGLADAAGGSMLQAAYLTRPAVAGTSGAEV